MKVLKDPIALGLGGIINYEQSVISFGQAENEKNALDTLLKTTLYMLSNPDRKTIVRLLVMLGSSNV